MEKKIIGLKSKASGLLDKAKEKAVNVLDQDGDGQLDMKDVAVVKDAAKEFIDQKQKERERKELQPIFEEDIDDSDFYMSRLVRITDMDKKHRDSELCVGSIGFISSSRDFNVVNIYSDAVDKFGLSFYPDTSCEIYYVDPTDRDRYIALDEYFSYLKLSRVTELQRIAQDLGAKYIKIVYKEKHASISKKDKKAKMGLKMQEKGGDINGEMDATESEASTMGIVTEYSFPGHNPIRPTLKYLYGDPSVEALIESRMHQAGPSSNQKLTLDFSITLGIKKRDALKIDSFLKDMKLAGDTTVSSEVQKESRRFLEYEIEF